VKVERVVVAFVKLVERATSDVRLVVASLLRAWGPRPSAGLPGSVSARVVGAAPAAPAAADGGGAARPIARDA
jgi:hypothetical protein